MFDSDKNRNMSTNCIKTLHKKFMKISSEIFKYLHENRRTGRSAEANQRTFYRFLLQNFEGEMRKVENADIDYDSFKWSQSAEWRVMNV